MEPNKLTAEFINKIDTKEDARKAADLLGLKYSGNTGLDTLKTKLLEAINTEIENPTTENNEEPEETPLSLFDVPEDDEDTKAKEEFLRKKKEQEDREYKQYLKEKAEADEIQVAKLPVKKPKASTSKLLKMDARNEPDPLTRRAIVRAKSLRLKRVSIQNLDPSEANVPGNIITVYNKYIGKVSKYIPNTSEEPYHIPQVIYNHLKEKKYVMRKEIPSKYGVKKYKTVLVPKYSIVDHPPLTAQELESLAKKQAAEGLIDE